MITVTGYIKNSSDVALNVLLTFNPTSTPFTSTGGLLIISDGIKVRTNPTDGSFTVDLEPGGYKLTCGSAPQINLSFTVPSSGGPYTLDQLINLPITSIPYTPCGGSSPEGQITADPGYPFYDSVNGAFYIKASGNGNTGWQKIVQL